MAFRRKFIQLLSALLYNANVGGFANGSIYKGLSKGICVPGLNCYSCPGAIAACPLGSLQAALGMLKYKLPLYTLGMLLLFGLLLGRAVCAFFCPFGLIQELLHKIPSPKVPKSPFTRRFSLLKYLILLIFVLVLPLSYLWQGGISIPAFCKYICPAGTLEGGLPLMWANESLHSLAGALFRWKMLLLALTMIAAIIIYRPFCRFICPLGAIYGLFNKYALFGIKVDTKLCNGCQACIKACRLDTRHINDRECIRCGECSALCGQQAIYYQNRSVKNEQTIPK